jgi:hypothetical protein
MGFLDSLFQPGDITEQGQVKSQTNFPQWYNRLNQANLLRATETAFEPYQAYQGPRQALSGKNQRDARQGISDISGIAAPSFAEAMNQSRLGATQLAGTDMRPYMSPYQQGVTDIALREARKQGDIQRNQLNSKATLSGAFGGSRAALEQMESERNIQQNLGDIQATGSQRAFESAIAQLMGDRAAASQAAPQMAALGTGLQGVLTSGLKESELAGERERSERQGALDIAYQDFLTQRQYPMAQASGLQSLLTGASVPGSSLQTTFGQPPSTGGQVGGLLMTGLGAYLGAGGAGLGAKDGGEIGVRRYQDGFEVEELDDPGAVTRTNPRFGAYSDISYDPSSVISAFGRGGLGQQAIDRQERIRQSENELIQQYYGQPEPVQFLRPPAGRSAGVVNPEHPLWMQAQTLGNSRIAQSETDILAEQEAMVDNGGPRFDPDVAQRFPMTDEAPDTAPDTAPDPADTESGKGFDYDLLLELGLGMMAAGAVPGSTVAGSLGQGGLSALQNRRDADALSRKEALESRQLDIAERGQDQDYRAAFASLNQDQRQEVVDIMVNRQSDLLEALADSTFAIGPARDAAQEEYDDLTYAIDNLIYPDDLPMMNAGLDE